MKGKFINKPLFNLSRKNGLKLFIGFGAFVSFMIVFTLALFPFIKDVVAKVPEIGEMMVLTNIVDYFNAEAIEMWIVLVSIYSAVLAINLTTTEFKNGSYELIYTLNMSRCEIVRTKIVRLVLNTIYLNVICFVVSLACVWIFAGFGAISVVNLLIYMILAIVVTLQVGAIVFALGLINKKNFNTFIGAFIVLVMFLFTTLSGVSQDGKFDWIAYISPISTMKGDVIKSGFKGIFSNGIVLLIWTVVSTLILLLACRKFKNDDLCQN